MSNANELGTKPIGTLLLKYSIPAVIAMLVNAIYNVVDRIFIGEYAGELALGALNIVFPLMMLVFSFAVLIGIGGAGLISIKLGEKNQKNALEIFNNMNFMGLIVGFGVLFLSYFNLEKILMLFGANADVLPYAMSYTTIILLGIIFQMIAVGLNNVVRNDGKPIFAMITMLVAAALNIILDYIFIGRFGWGVEGAAFATIIAQLAGFLLLIGYFFSGKSLLRFKLNLMVPKVKNVIKIIKVGGATFFTTFGVVVASVFINISLNKYGGNAALTSMAAINSIYAVFILPIIGLQHGLQPIVGYNHGANNTNRTIRALKLAIISGVIFSTIMFIILELVPEMFIELFINSDSDTFLGAVRGLRIFIIMLPLLCINLIGASYFQSIASVKKALFLSLIRQIIFLIPIVLILPIFKGLDGVWLATPVSDGLAVLVTILLVIPVLKNKEQKQIENINENVS